MAGTGGMLCCPPCSGVSNAVPVLVRTTPFIALPRFGLLLDARRDGRLRAGGVLCRGLFDDVSAGGWF